MKHLSHALCALLTFLGISEASAARRDLRPQTADQEPERKVSAKPEKDSPEISEKAGPMKLDPEDEAKIKARRPTGYDENLDSVEEN